MHSSKLPMFLSLFAGSTALLFVAKLHGAEGSAMSETIFILSQLISPLFSLNNTPYLSLNALLIIGLLSGTLTMSS